jgi:hypothetical protein
MALAGALSLPYVVAGFYLLSLAANRSSTPASDLLLGGLGLAAILFFGFGEGMAVYWLLTRGRKPALILDEGGIRDRSSFSGAGLIRWDEIEAVTLKWFPGQRLLFLHLRNPESIIARQKPFVQRAMRSSLCLVGTPVVLSQTNIGIPLEQVKALIEERLITLSTTNRSDTEPK